MQWLNSIEELDLDEKSQRRLSHILEVMFFGELHGLHNLHSILQVLHIGSHNLYKIWSDYSAAQIKALCIMMCERSFEDTLEALLGKSDSSWSRAEVTIIIDDSIFKQWLKNMPRGAEYDCFFSGQVKRSVYGFCVNLIGVSINACFYPLYFEFVPKGKDSNDVALSSLKKVHQLFKKAIQKAGKACPNIYLSVDSGFTGEGLMTYCKDNDIGYIGVPKKNNVIYIGAKKWKIAQYIKEVFLKEEAEFDEQQQVQSASNENVEGEKVVFFKRVKVYYQAIDREVILVFFRLNGSNKVSVIFSFSMQAKAKTLRRRFFQRTKIELFFRFLKDTLKIQLSPSKDLERFEKKLALFILKAMYCFCFEYFCHKTSKRLRRMPFTTLRRYIIYEQIGLDDLNSLIKKGAFAS